METHRTLFSSARPTVWPPTKVTDVWPSSFFLILNLGWFAIWVCAAFGLRTARSIALFPAWFLAIAGILNGVAHSLLWVSVGGYFPGLLTSPIAGVASLVLWTRLTALTHARS